MKRVLMAGLLWLSACGQKQDAVIRPLVQQITESVYAPGVVKSRNQYEVFSTVPGIVAQIQVREGDTVRRGDVLMRLRSETQQLSAENAQLAASYTSVTANASRLQELKTHIEQAGARMQLDSALYQRQRRLWSEKIGTLNELEQRELAWNNSAAAYRAALLQYQNLSKEIRFAAQQAQKNLQISNALRGDYTIRALQDGRVYRILKEAGELVAPQSPVAVLGDADEFVLELQVDELDIGKIRPGQRVFINMDSYRGQVFEARLSRIQPIMDERARSFEVEAVFTQQPPRLYPNLTVEANILIRTKDSALTIPRAYLAGDDQVVLKDGSRRKVVTGLKDYQRVEIIRGLSKEDELSMPE